jgi:hypothetical protein
MNVLLASQFVSMPACPLYTGSNSCQLILSKNHDKRRRQLETTTVFVLWREMQENLHAKITRSDFHDKRNIERL